MPPPLSKEAEGQLQGQPWDPLPLPQLSPLFLPLWVPADFGSKLTAWSGTHPPQPWIFMYWQFSRLMVHLEIF